ncbi:kinase-like protein [Amniculicola lignicola CBS 123094]|uniref:Kinase-like protein n=1 Tax=Amniculicola lignicola CBS 123094 TaxID=1392246 RepID=A0A6A5X539_9PLEO|nr:kinase-like protein [Amniculicola lignicola CBS 123094]
MAPLRIDIGTIPEDEAVLAIESAPASIDEIFRQGWYRGHSHVNFTAAEEVPLRFGRLLGHGISLGVYGSRWRGHVIAVKQVTLRPWGKRDRKTWREEVEREAASSRNLDHRHVIRLIGTYTYQDVFGLLLWPVAVCDLATFLADVDKFRDTYAKAIGKGSTNSDSFERLRCLGFDLDGTNKALVAMRSNLYQTMPCLINALQYIHGKGIKHKDLKPNNILISRGGLWLTDFGVSTDFSALSRSLTDNGIRGTPRYFPPEVANYELCGRRSDIFSMGCIFIQVFWSSVVDRPMEDFDAYFLSEGNRTFRDNINILTRWCMYEGQQISGSTRNRRLLLEIRSMIRDDQKIRPYATEVAEALAVIDNLAETDEGEITMYSPCCMPESSVLLKAECDILRAQILKKEASMHIQAEEEEEEDLKGEVLEIKRPSSIFSIRSRLSTRSTKSIWGWLSNKDPMKRGTQTRARPVKNVAPYGAHLQRVQRSH